MFQPNFCSTQKPKRMRVAKSHIQTTGTEPAAIASVNFQKLPTKASETGNQLLRIFISCVINSNSSIFLSRSAYPYSSE